LRRSNQLTRNGMLDLDTRVDLNEVVSALLVDKELCCTGITVIDGFCELERVVEYGLTDGLVEVRSRSDFHDLTSSELVDGSLARPHLLMTSLHGTVSLKEVDAVPLTVRKELHLDVSGVVQKAC
jgi:hypothetical protein